MLDTLIFSLTVGMSVSDTSGKTIANLGYESVVFERPMFPGDSLYAESEVLEMRESASKPDRGIVAVETRGFNQNKERVIVLRRRFLAPKKVASHEGIHTRVSRVPPSAQAGDLVRRSSGSRPLLPARLSGVSQSEDRARNRRPRSNE